MKRALLATAAVGAAFLSGCQKPPPAEPPPVRPVLSMLVAPATSGQLALAGTVQPRVQTAFGFRVLGRLIARPVNVGDIVEAGQVLAAIDPVALKLATQAAEADLTNNAAQLANATGVEERQAALLKSNATTQALYDAAEQAKATAQAGVARAQAALNKSREQFGYAILKSDFAGVVTGVGAEIGQTVSPGQTVVNVAEPSQRDAVIDVPDSLASALTLGEQFTVAQQLDSSIQAQGKVREIAPEADAATRTRRMKIALENPPQTFRLGSTITASLASGAPPFVRLPASAILEKDGRAQVWIVDSQSSTVALRDVTITKTNDDSVDVLTGLEPAMRVVTAGVHSLVEGQKVKIEGEAP